MRYRYLFVPLVFLLAVARTAHGDIALSYFHTNDWVTASGEVSVQLSGISHLSAVLGNSTTGEELNLAFSAVRLGVIQPFSDFSINSNGWLGMDSPGAFDDASSFVTWSYEPEGLLLDFGSSAVLKSFDLHDFGDQNPPYLGTLTLIHNGQIFGTWDGPGSHYDVNLAVGSGDTVELQVVAGAFSIDQLTFAVYDPADTDRDYDVDTADLTTMFQNFTGDGGMGKTMMQGDTDGDGDVDTADITTGLQNFTGAQAALASVPEPSTWLLLLLGSLCLPLRILRRRRLK